MGQRGPPWEALGWLELGDWWNERAVPVDVAGPEVLVAFHVELLAASLVGKECGARATETFLAKGGVVDTDRALDQRACRVVDNHICRVNGSKGTRGRQAPHHYSRRCRRS